MSREIIILKRTAPSPIATLLVTDALIVDNIEMSMVPTGDDAYVGEVLVDKLLGATVAQWEAVYFDFTSGKWKLADANGSSTYPAGGLSTTAGVDTDAAIILVRGTVRNDTWNWSAGPIYLSATAGGLTQTAPSTSGDKVQIVGYAISGDVAYFHFNPTYVEVA